MNHIHNCLKLIIISFLLIFVITGVSACHHNNQDGHQSVSRTRQKYSRSSPSDIVRYAKSQIDKHHYSETLGTSRKSRNGMLNHPKNGYADCSSFVYFVYRHCGYKVTSFRYFNHNAWSQEGTIHGPKRVSKYQTRPGSICQNPIHMVILEEKYHGPKTKVIEEGGYWNGHNHYRHTVNEGYLGGAFTPKDGHYIFYNPIKK